MKAELQSGKSLVAVCAICAVAALVGLWFLGRWSADRGKKDKNGAKQGPSAVPPTPVVVDGMSAGDNGQVPLRAAHGGASAEGASDRPQDGVSPKDTAKGQPSADEARDSSLLEDRAPRGGKAAPGAVRALREAFHAFRNAGGGDDAESEFRTALGELERSDLLAAAAELMRSGVEQDRLDALFAVAEMFGKVPGEVEVVEGNVDDGGEGNGDGGEGNADSESGDASPAMEAEAAETHDLVAVVEVGLEDSSAEVRSLAYETARTLPAERAGILLSQILCSDSPISADIRQQCLQDIAGSRDPADVSLLMQALQSPDPDTALLARSNLQTIAGKSLPTDEAAMAWWEEYQTPPVSDSDEPPPPPEGDPDTFSVPTTTLTTTEEQP